VAEPSFLHCRQAQAPALIRFVLGSRGLSEEDRRKLSAERRKLGYDDFAEARRPAPTPSIYLALTRGAESPPPGLNAARPRVPVLETLP